MESKTGIYYGDMVNQDIVDAVTKLKLDAAKARREVKDLSPMVKAMGARQLAILTRILDGIEGL